MNRQLVVLALGSITAAAAVGIVVGLNLTGSTKLLTLPTTGSFTPITVPKPLVPTYLRAQGIDPDSEIREGADLNLTLAPAGAHHEYRLTVTNISGAGTFNSFNWVPPANIEIVKVLGSSRGTCVATGTTGFGGKQFSNPDLVVNPHIACTAVNLKPPSCTCRGDGGKVVITFRANQSLQLTGTAQVVAGTLSFNPIPGTLQAPDVAVCKHGESSTKANACASG